MKKYNEIDLEYEWNPLYGFPIILPENTVFWRGYLDTYPAVTDRFSYYSEKSVASGYVTDDTRKLGQFTNTKPLKLLDIRFMKVILSRLIQMNRDNDKSIQYLAAIVLSFGLCSLSHQIHLVKLRYSAIKNTDESIKESIKSLQAYYDPTKLIEQHGVRIAETTNDTYTMGFLQELFKDRFDGFISPRLYSPFHVEKPKKMMSPEIIIFNPKASGIELLESEVKPINKITIEKLIYQNHNHIILENKNKNIISMEFYMYGGKWNNSTKHHYDIIEESLNENDKNIHKLYNEGKKAGKKCRSKIDIYSVIPPTPCVEVSPFSTF
jgi:hypothetical protein